MREVLRGFVNDSTIKALDFHLEKTFHNLKYFNHMDTASPSSYAYHSFLVYESIVRFLVPLNR